jgi:hypothetical protein
MLAIIGDISFVEIKAIVAFEDFYRPDNKDAFPPARLTMVLKHQGKEWRIVP